MLNIAMYLLRDLGPLRGFLYLPLLLDRYGRVPNSTEFRKEVKMHFLDMENQPYDPGVFPDCCARLQSIKVEMTALEAQPRKWRNRMSEKERSQPHSYSHIAR